jgi:osmoprotectant transport system permease protein
VGWAPAFVVLFLYALLPIAGNTFAALRSVAPEALDAARGMGMSRRQTFLRVQAPLALPVILAGIRTAFTANMGNAILAALVGGGGLGTLVFLGLAQAAPDLILLGALSTSALALAADRALALAFRLAVSRGLRSEAS